MTRTAAIKSLTAPQKKALAKLYAQVKAGETTDLNCSGIRRDTLRALRSKGFIRFDNIHEITYNTGRMGFGGKTRTEVVFNVSWAW